MKTDTVHVLPVNDLRTHVEVGTWCHCLPRIEREHGGAVVIHNAYDGREFGEQVGMELKVQKNKETKQMSEHEKHDHPDEDDDPKHHKHDDEPVPQPLDPPAPPPPPPGDVDNPG